MKVRVMNQSAFARKPIKIIKSEIEDRKNNQKNTKTVKKIEETKSKLFCNLIFLKFEFKYSGLNLAHCDWIDTIKM